MTDYIFIVRNAENKEWGASKSLLSQFLTACLSKAGYEFTATETYEHEPLANMPPANKLELPI